MKLLIPLVVILVIALTIAIIYARSQKRRVDGVSDPSVWLSRKERREHAKELLKREKDQYELSLQQDLMKIINKENQ